MTEKVICRTCLTEKTDDSSNQLQKITENEEEIFKKLFETAISEDHDLPKFICQKCSEKLQNFFEFHEMVLKSVEKFKNCLKTEEFIKEEHEDDDFRDEEVDPGDILASNTSEEDIKNVSKRRKRTKMIKSQVEREDQEIQNFFNLSCSICSKDQFVHFPIFRLFSTHMKENHNVKVPFVLCCKKKLFKRSELLDHLNYHNHPEKYQCPLCKHQCSDIYQLKKHTNKCEGPDRPENFKCDECSLTFSSINTLSSHKNVHLTREEKDLKRSHACDRCSARFTSIYGLKRHLKERHEGKSSFLCHSCAKSFYSKSDFLVHWKSIHGTSEKIKCPECGSMLKHERALRRHLRNMHQSKGPWICKKCGKETPTIEALRSHERYSHNETVKLHECNICDKKFRKILTLREHMSTHYDAKNQLTCDNCDKTFNSSTNLIKHRKKMHLE